MTLPAERIRALRVLHDVATVAGWRCVLIGASVPALLVSSGTSSRVTFDADTIVSTRTWDDYEALRRALEARGFRRGAPHQMFSPEDAGIDTFSADLYDLLQAFHSVLNQVKKIEFHEVYEEVVTIDEKIALIKNQLGDRNEILFKQLFGETRTKNELIATFFALLEIVRTRFARVKQAETFGDIMIQKI